MCELREVTMRQGLPCLNPACDFEFSPLQVQGAAALTCPRCGHVFQMDVPESSAATKISKQKTVVPKARRVDTVQLPSAPVPLSANAEVDVELVKQALPPSAERAAHSPESIPTAGDAGAAVFAGDDNAVVSAPTYPKTTAKERRRTWVIVAGIAVAVIVLPVLVVAALVIYNPAGGAVTADSYDGYFFNSRKSSEKAFVLRVPYAEARLDTWKPNPEFKKLLRAAVALEKQFFVDNNEHPDTLWLAVAGKDFHPRQPRDSELLKGAIQRLEKFFGQQLELETQPDVRQLGGKRSLVLQFVGERNSVHWEGEVHAMTHHGFAYWLFIAGNDYDSARSTWKKLEETNGLGLRLTTKRSGWKPRPRTMKTFVAPDKTVALSAPEDDWHDFPADNLDPGGVLYLQGMDSSGAGADTKKNLRTARILVLGLEKKTKNLKEAMKLAKSYVAEKYKAEGPTYELKSIGKKGSQDGVLFKFGATNAILSEMRLHTEDGPWKYVLLAAVRGPDRTYVFRCDSFKDYHQAWRGEFFDVLNTMTIRAQIPKKNGKKDKKKKEKPK